MASISGSRPLPDTRSGGKIIRPRRTRSAKTPYDRPQTSNSNARSPNWLSRFVFSPTRFIASGAGKLISSVFDLNSSPASSSSSSSACGSDFEAEVEIGTFDNANDIPVQDDTLKKTGTSEVIDCSGKELQPLIGRSQNKIVIEQLLMQETYSREECDRLIKIIRSRVATSENEGDTWLSEMLNRTLASDAPDLCSAAVMEARKWLKEKKPGSDSKSDLGYGSRSLNLVTSLQVFEDEGSPVDVARSYMQALPSWASPSRSHIKPSSPVGNKLFKELTPYPIDGNSRSSSKLKRDSLAAGSWSIQDEMRRVRSRATEQMLSDLPSSKIDWSAFALGNKNTVNLSANGNTEASAGEKACNLTNSMDASLNSARGLGTEVSLDLERKEDGFQPEAVLSDSVPINHDQHEGAEAARRNENEVVRDERREMTSAGQKPMLSNAMMTMVNSHSDVLNVDDAKVPKPKPWQTPTEETGEASDSRLHDGNCSALKDKVGADDALANGFLLSEPSSHAGHIIDRNSNSLDKENNTVDSGHERIAKEVVEQEACELLSETSMDVPDVNINDTALINEGGVEVTGSQNSSGVELDAKLDNAQHASKPELATSTYSIAKNRGKRITRNSKTDRSTVVK